MPIAKTTTVVIVGPNLQGGAQRKGAFHVHAAGCADLRHYGEGRKFGGDTGWDVEVSSRREIVEEIYADHIAENPGASWEDYDDLHVAPCVHFPEQQAKASSRKRTLPQRNSVLTAADIAREAGIDPRAFRAWLRASAKRANREPVKLTPANARLLVQSFNESR